MVNVKMLLADNDKVKKNVAYFNVMDKPSNYKILENTAYIIKVNGCEKAANIVTLEVKGGMKIFLNETHKEIKDTPFNVIREATFEEMNDEQSKLNREGIDLWKPLLM